MIARGVIKEMTAFSKTKNKTTEGNRYILWGLVVIELFMSFSFLGYIHIEPISMTFVYIPVLVAACILGPKEGALLGSVFGLASMWKASAFYVGAGDTIFSPVMSGKPIQSFLLSVASRALFGWIAGILYKIAKESKHPEIGILIVSSIGRAVHTFCVYLFMGLLFPEIGLTPANTLDEIFKPDYLLFVIVVDLIVWFFYKFRYSDHVKRFMKQVSSVDKINSIAGNKKGKIAVLAVLVAISSFSVAAYYTNRIGNVMRNYGIDLSTEISYDLMHLQIQFLLGMLSLAALAIIVIILYQKNTNYLYYEAQLDGLTGLCSRQLFFQEGETILCRMKFTEDEPGGYFIIMDIDYFKEINDQCGHPMGDGVLKLVAEYLEKLFGNKGIIGRLGGDEFVVLVSHPASKSEIEDTLNKMREELAAIQAGERNVTCSIGVIPVESGYTIDQLYRSADRLLYEAKKNGKNQFVFGYRFQNENPKKTSKG